MQRAGVSQAELSRVMDVRPQSVSLWVTGKTIPTAAHLIRLAGILECSVDDLLRADEGAAG
jgi:transcriptional regulator with XRE-family HTH domain